MTLKKNDMEDVLKFLDRVINGRLIDSQNHHDDSMFEIGNELARFGHHRAATATLDVAVHARLLRKRLIGV